MTARRLFVGGALLALGIGTGCVVEVDFDPYGSDFAIVGSWTVNGEAPSPANCEAAGIDRVRLVFYDGGSPFFFDDLEAPCAAGGFDTGRVFRWGSYQTRWEAVLTDGTSLRDDRGIMPLVVNSPITEANTMWPIELEVVPTFDPFGTDDSISADWTIGGVAPDTTSCAAAGIATIEVVLFAEGDADYTEGVVVGGAPCASGKWDTRDPGEGGAIIADGRYRTSIDAVDGGGGILASFRFPDPLDTTAVTHAMLATADFTVAPPPTTLRINFGWDTDPTLTMADGTCADAGVAGMWYMLTDSGGTVVQMVEDSTCQDSVEFIDIAADTYSIYVEGDDASDAKLWVITCTDLVVAEGAVEEYNCSVEQRPPGT